MTFSDKDKMYSDLNMELTEVQIELADLYVEIRASKEHLGGPVLQKRRLELEVKLEGLNRRSVELDELFGG